MRNGQRAAFAVSSISQAGADVILRQFGISNSHYVGWTSDLPAPRYRGAVIIVLTVAVPLAPLGVGNFVRRQISVFPLPCSN